MTSNAYLGGGLSVAGVTVPAEVVNDILAHMRTESFTCGQLIEVAKVSLRKHKVPVTTCFTLAERMITKHSKAGRITRAIPGRVPVWAWAAPQ
jgi:hypothetical protein